MPSPTGTTCLRVPRLPLIHAILAYISPEFTQVSHLPLPLPTEIRLRILTHLHLTLSVSLLESFHSSLYSLLDDLCDSCRTYNFHVYGENVSEWPQINVTGGCWCAKIRAHVKPGFTQDSLWDSEACTDVKFRFPIADFDPPPYFISHLRHIAVTYLSTTSASPYTRELEALVTPHAGAKEIDALVSRVLRRFHCCISPSTSRAWNLGDRDELCITPISMHPSDEIICTLRLALELDIHRGFISNSKLHPRNVKFTPPLIVHPSGKARDSTHLLSNSSSANAQLVYAVGLACILLGLRYYMVAGSYYVI